MGELIIPEPAPPLVAVPVRKELEAKIVDHGLKSVWDKGIATLYFSERELMDYIDSFSLRPAEGVPEDDRPQRAFRIGAVVSGLAYYMSGYEVDASTDKDPEEMVNMDLRFEGLKSAFALSYMVDLELQRLMGRLLSAPEMQDGIELWRDYTEVTTQGAGCTRHFLKFAAQAA